MDKQPCNNQLGPHKHDISTDFNREGKKNPLQPTIRKYHRTNINQFQIHRRQKRKNQNSSDYPNHFSSVCG